jgi:hypothetical protein
MEARREARMTGLSLAGIYVVCLLLAAASMV